MAGLINHRYRILQVLAEGGFGRTFLAEDVQMPSRQRCVIKQLKLGGTSARMVQTAQRHFAREAAVLELVSKGNPQVPDLYAYFAEGDQFYLVQEWIEGTPLHQTIPPVWSEARTIKFLMDVLPALALVHQHHIIHRDIKPENIVLRSVDRLPCLIDFGAVKALMNTVVPAGEPLARSTIVGTPGFMPPEQVAGRPTFASDLYSLGMTAICLLTGRSPQDIPVDSHTGHLRWRPYAKGVSDRTATLLTRCIHLHPQNRYASVTEMLKALDPNIGIGQRSPVDRPNVPWKYVGLSVTVLAAGVVAIALVQSQPAAAPSVETPLKETSAPENDIEELTTQIESAAGALTKTPGNESVRKSLALDYQQRAEQLYAEGREALALEDIERSVDIDPAQTDAFVLRGDILINQSRPDFLGAIAAYTQTISNSQISDSKAASVLGKRCRAHMALKDWASADADCTQSLSLNATNADIYADRGDIYAAQSEFDKATQQYDTAIAMNKKSGIDDRSLYYRRSQAREKLGDIEGALLDLQHVKTSQ